MIESVQPDGELYLHDGISPLILMQLDVFLDPESKKIIYRDAAALACPGFGPLMYDLAVELASSGGGGLMTGTGLNENSMPVWEFYRDHRKDVKIIQFSADHPWWKIHPQIDPDFPFRL